MTLALHVLAFLLAVVIVGTSLAAISDALGLP